MRTSPPTRVPESSPRTVFLVGFMGAGKTSVGRALSQRLGWSFEDLDDRIQSREGRSIEQIFRESGEPAFRRAEHAALLELLGQLEAARVIALGGGAFAQPNNVAALESAGVAIVFLDGPVDELFQRCQQQKLDRPLRSDLEQFRTLYHSRRAYYLKATLRIDTGGKDVPTVTGEVAEGLGLASPSVETSK